MVNNIMEISARKQTVEQYSLMSISSKEKIRRIQYLVSIVLIISMCVSPYYDLRPLHAPGILSIYLLIVCVLWVFLAVIFRRYLSVVVASLPFLVAVLFSYSGLTFFVVQRGFVGTRAPFAAYEQSCRRNAYVAEGHKIEFCERVYTDGGLPADIMRDEGGAPWTPGFQDSQTFRQALEYHSKNSPDSSIYSIHEILSSISDVKIKYNSIGMGFYIVKYDPGY